MTDSEDTFFEMLHAAESGDFSPPDEADLLQDPGDLVRSQCDEWAQAAVQLRFAPDRWPGPQASAEDVKNALVEVRARLDALEGILGRIMALKAGAMSGARGSENAADDAWDRQAEAERHRPRPEYQGSKERYAYWNLAIREDRARARQARDLADYVRAVHDGIKLAYDGLNETRRDLASRLTHFRWETHIEQ